MLNCATVVALCTHWHKASHVCAHPFEEVMTIFVFLAVR